MGILDGLSKLATDLRDQLERDGRIVLIGSDAPTEIVSYRGYGNDQRVLIKGRVMAASGIAKSADGDSHVRNLYNTYRRIRSHPVPHAVVDVTIGATRQTLTADNEGFFRGWIDLKDPVAGDATWIEASLRLAQPTPGVSATARIRRVSADATFGIISDLDDTVIQSRVSNFLLAVRTIMLGNARTRLPFPGVSAFYQALEKGGDGQRRNPIYYVSSSPWNLYDLIAEFLELQKIPDGPICLRDWDIDIDALTSSRLKQHKEPLIREILELHPSLPFILIGDTSQQDPEIYWHIVREFPGRILAVYIRNVDPNPERSAAVRKLAEEILAAGSTLVLADDSAAAAKHAAEKGWITPETLPGIESEKRQDETGPAAPTIVVE